MKQRVYNILMLLLLVMSTFVRYHPYLDLIRSYDKYILPLWYDKDGGRTYIKLFEYEL